MNSTTQASTLLPAKPISLQNHAPSPAPKVLRSSVFSARRRPVDLRGLLRPLIEAQAPRPASQWVIAAAWQLCRRLASPPPARWVETLARGLNCKLSSEIEHCNFDALPRAAWNEPSLLGETLAAARDAAESLKRSGRAGRSGRISVGSVYTPAVLARAIVSEVHVGPRRVLDPACGAGVFLLEAFERAYRRRLESGAAPVQAAEDALRHEITGIDVDHEALAVAEFSLRAAAFRLAGLERDVPIDLRHADALKTMPDLDGQCECIVGNPPYIEGRGLSGAELARLRRIFRCAASGKVNLFAVFVERALMLLKDGGVMALVLPATFQRNARYQPLREVLLQHTLESIKPVAPETFGERVVETVVLRVRKKPPLKTSRVQLSDGNTLQSRLPLGPVLRFCDHIPRSLRRQIELMERHGVPLTQFFEIRDGISTGFQPFPLKLIGRREKDQFVAGDGSSRAFDPALHRKIIDGSEFNSFTPVQWSGRFIEYDKRHEHLPPHPGKPFNCQLREAGIYDRAEKLLSRQTARGIIATVDREKYFVRNSVHVTYASPSAPFPTSLDALCACLNTRFYTNYLLAVTGESGDVFPQVHISDLRRLPILPGLLKADSALAALGSELLALHADRAKASLIDEEKRRAEDLLAAAFGIHD